MLTRFAPAPTGWLHLGHVRNAAYVWRAARERGGRVLLRIEDHDRIRSRPEYEAGILDDLDWLGFAADVHPTSAYRAGPCEGRQSERDGIYREALQILQRHGLVYACDCSRRAIVGSDPNVASDGTESGSDPNSPPDDAGLGSDPNRALIRATWGQTPDRALIGATWGQTPERRYDGRCRDRGVPIADGYGWRVRMDPGVERFDDERLGPQAQDPSAQCGDVLVRDRDGNWAYQFAVTVDDWRQEIDLVIRGVDLLASTGRQIRLARLLGRERPPAFLHHALILKRDGRKLSKSDGDSGVRDLRARGWTPHQVIDAALDQAS